MKYSRMETVTDQIKLYKGNRVKAKFKLKKVEDIKETIGEKKRKK